MRDFPLVSILINNFKGTKDLECCLDALLKTDYPNLELFVLDCCTPDFENWIKKFPTVKFFHTEQDIGTAAQRNLAFKNSNHSAKYVCFIDDDVIVTPQWLTIIVSYMEKHPDIGQAQPLLYNYYDKKKIDSIGYLFSHVGYSYRIRIEDIPNFNSQKVINTFYAEGTSVIRRKILSDMSKNSEPYDPDYSIMFEDVDLSWRIWLQGFKVVIILDSFCYHMRGISYGAGNLKPNVIFLNARNRLITIIKNSQTSDLVKFFPVTIFLEISKALILLRYNASHTKATFQAVFWTISHLPKILKKRNSSRTKDIKLMSDKIFVKTNLSQLRRDLKHQYNPRIIDDHLS